MRKNWLIQIPSILLAILLFAMSSQAQAMYLNLINKTSTPYKIYIQTKDPSGNLLIDPNKVDPIDLPASAAIYGFNSIGIPNEATIWFKDSTGKTNIRSVEVTTSVNPITIYVINKPVITYPQVYKASADKAGDKGGSCQSDAYPPAALALTIDDTGVSCDFSN